MGTDSKWKAPPPATKDAWDRMLRGREVGYRAITDEHYAEFAKSGISRELCDAAKICSFTYKESDHPNYAERSYQTQRNREFVGLELGAVLNIPEACLPVPAWVAPFFDPDGECIYVTAKPDNALPDPDKPEKVKKYLHPKALSIRLYTPPGAMDRHQQSPRHADESQRQRSNWRRVEGNRPR